MLRTPQATVVRDDEALPLARVNRPGRTDPARIVVREPDRVVIATPAGPGRPARAGRSALPGLVGDASTATPRPCASRTGSSARSTSPPGATRVEWRFAPRSVKLGLLISLATLLAAVAYAVFARRRSARRRS